VLKKQQQDADMKQKVDKKKEELKAANLKKQ